jgi:predicted esterase
MTTSRIRALFFMRPEHTLRRRLSGYHEVMAPRALLPLIVLGLALPGGAAAELLDLPVAAHEPAVLALPASGRGPVLVAALGSYDRPDWHCEIWGPIFPDRIVLCPRGTLRWDTPREPAWRRFYYRGVPRLRAELDAAVQALRARHRERVEDGPMIYLGFSQGAIYGVPLLAAQGDRFPRAILIEGGTAWSREAAQSYAARGGRRVLFACGQAGCVSRARSAAALLSAAGVRTRIVHAPRTGHTYDGAVADQIRASAAWLLAPER